MTNVDIKNILRRAYDNDKLVISGTDELSNEDAEYLASLGYIDFVYKVGSDQYKYELTIKGEKFLFR